jgi:hypothetical protein
VHGNYRCSPHGDCPDAYDGLHPNSMGEWHIAEKFVQSLINGCHFDNTVPFRVTSTMEERTVSTPRNFQTKAVDEGILSTWDADPLARGYL